MKSLGLLKALGPDGVNAMFYQNYETIGDSVAKFVSKAFKLELDLQNVNHTHVVLIPKYEYPEQLTQFHLKSM